MEIGMNAAHAAYAALSAPVADAQAQGGSAPQPATLVPDPLAAMVLSDDLIAQITGMLALSFRDDRKQARKLAHLEDRAQASETRMRISRMLDKAEATRAAGMWSGIGQIASGALTASAALAAPCPVASPGAEGAAANCASKVLEGVLRGSAEGASGAGKIAEGEFKARAEEQDAMAAEHESNATGARRRGDLHRDDVSEAKRMLDKVAEFLREVRTGQNSAKSAALYRA